MRDGKAAMSPKSKVELPSLLMVLSFTANMFIGFLDPTKMPVPKEIGLWVFLGGSLFFVYVLLYLRSGFFGDTKPNLGFLITKGPYQFCRHPQYLSFVIMVLGFDLMLRSPIGIAFTFALSIPSAIYRAKIEDKLLGEKFGEEWEQYADSVGFILPRLRKKTTGQ